MCFGKKLDEVGWKVRPMFGSRIADLMMMTYPLEETCKTIYLGYFFQGRPLRWSSQCSREK